VAVKAIGVQPAAARAADGISGKLKGLLQAESAGLMPINLVAAATLESVDEPSI
jgi:hypothetical protein